MLRNGLDGPFQMAGRHFAMGCVALEITQRCNLDCTLCYLSDHSEAVRDLPLPEIFRRIDRIRHDYGRNTNVQITGGDPTLRATDDLVAIVARVRDLEMTPALFTNGIKATRKLLTKLAAAGLRDVAFHVDMTQGRKGYASETELNALRLDYIERARGLGLHIIFNTTLFDENMASLSDLARFFVEQADHVRMASFQLQADTGRGVLGKTAGAVTIDGAIARINEGAGVDLNFGWPAVGHPDCNRYGSALIAGRAVTPLFDAPALFAALFEKAQNIRLDRHRPARTAASLGKLTLRHPRLAARSLAFAARKLSALRRGVVANRGRINKLTFYLHNFMDAKRLDRARCETCVFMVMTSDGPVSMCVHNAKRDDYILQPLSDMNGNPWRPSLIAADQLPVKRLKGRLKRGKMEIRDR